MTKMRTVGAPALIVGGGIVGCATAYYLAQRGIPAVLLEKSVIGAEASGRSAGGVRAQCRDRRERPLALASIRLWEKLDNELGLDTHYVQGGNIRVAANEARMAQLVTESEEELADGLEVEVWDREQLRRRAPYLSGDFAGAKYCAIDGVANPIWATWAFARAARQAGATLLTHAEVVEVEVQRGHVTSVRARRRHEELRVETPLVIHAGGAWTAQLGRTLGIHIPLKPARAVIGVTQRVPPLFTEFVSSHDLRVYVRPAREGHVHMGGIGAAVGTFDKRVPPEGLALLARSTSMVPALRNTKLLRAWAGTLAMTPDGVPIIGPVDGVQGYILATGFSGHGFCLAPVVGMLLSELVVDGEASWPVDDLHLSRFASVPRHKRCPGRGEFQ